MDFYTSGKLLIAGEYLVLNGATAFAVPTLGYGQKMSVFVNDTDRISWKSYDPEGKWFEAVFSTDLKILSTSNKRIADTLYKILLIIKQKSNLFSHCGYDIKTVLEFDRNWGFGSSSTMIVNLSKWSGVNVFELLQAGFGGSGYDVATGLANSPVLYRLSKNDEDFSYKYKDWFPVWETIDFHPDFIEKLWLVYLGHKQNSRKEIKRYQKQIPERNLIEKISDISLEISKTNDYQYFNKMINEHERLMSAYLKRPAIKQEYFMDYPGEIKSLGAWGGDFILATGDDAPEYFRKKSYHIILPFKKILK
jgi:mevalonate kinase